MSKLKEIEKNACQVYFNIFNAEILVFWNCSIRDLYIYLDITFDNIHKETLATVDEYANNQHELQDGVTFYDKIFPNSYVWLKDTPENPKTIGILAHEALHAIIHMLSTHNIPINEHDDELICRCLDYLVRSVLERVLETNSYKVVRKRLQGKK